MKNGKHKWLAAAVNCWKPRDHATTRVKSAASNEDPARLNLCTSLQEKPSSRPCIFIHESSTQERAGEAIELPS